MRKITALLLALVLFCSAGIVWVHAAINAERNRVEIRENCLFGDKAAASGLNIVRNVQWDGHLHWSTAYSISGQDDYSTDFRFTQNEENDGYRAEYVPDGISFTNYANAGVGSNRALTESMLFEVFGGYAGLCMAAMERAPAGGEYYENVKIADYYEYYPLNIEWDMPEVYTLEKDEEGNENFERLAGKNFLAMNAAFLEYFRIPVQDEDMLELTLYKTEAGEVTDLSVNSMEANWYQIFSVVTADGVYFTFSNGSAVDFSQIPGGYGLYYLPFTEIADYSGVKYTVADASGMQTVQLLVADGSSLLHEGVELMAFFMSGDEERMIMITNEDGTLFFNSMNPGSTTLEQRFAIAECEESYYIGVNDELADCIIFEIGMEQISVVDILPGEGYALNFTVTRPDMNTAVEYYYGAGNVYAYDGERLAVGRNIQTDISPYESCGFLGRGI